MNKFFTDLWAKIKALWGKLAKPVKILIPAAACALIIAVAVSIIISAGKKSEYQVLFNGENLSQSETNSAYAELQSWGVSARLNSAGQIEVPTEQADTVMLRMAENGFTQSTPGYSMFFDNISITMTEFEKKETLRMATEEKMNALLRRFEGIRNAEVMLSVPENVDRVWKSEEEKAAEKASASVSLWLEPGAKFDHNSVSAVKNLVSYNVEKMTPDDVTVIDAGNGVRELTGVEDVVEGFDELGSEERRRFYEGLTEQGYEEKVHKIFDPVFGAENVSVAATASLDYDKVIEEITELIPANDDTGAGFMDEAFLNWITPRDLELGPNGVVGEEPNTENPDPPIYPNEADDTLTNQDASDYTKKLHWLFGEHVTQIERSRGVVQDASVSVIVKSEIVRLTPAERAEYEALVANATNINPDSISFRNQYVAPDPGPLPPNPTFLDIFLQWLPYMLMGLFLLVVVAVVIIKIIADQNRKKALAIEMQNNEKVRALEAELFEKNRSLAEQASEQNREKENVAQQIKDFVTQNPEIAAGLIRSMIKGEE